MKVFKIYFHVGDMKAMTVAQSRAWRQSGEGGVVVGIVVNQDGTMTSDQALSLWNSANPSYQGDTALDGPFMLH